jgi:hypothetical protein
MKITFYEEMKKQKDNEIKNIVAKMVLQNFSNSDLSTFMKTAQRKAGEFALRENLFYSTRSLGYIRTPGEEIYVSSLSFLKDKKEQVERSIEIINALLKGEAIHKDYYFIEIPIRFGKKKISMQKVIFLIVCMIAIGVTGASIYIQKGMQTRLASSTLKIKNEGDIGQDDFFQYLKNNYYLCTPEDIRAKSFNWDGTIRCFQSKKNAPIDIAIIGDSHAEHLFVGLAEAIPTKNIVYYDRAALPIIGNHEFDRIFDYVTSNKSLRIVILNAYWSSRRNEKPKNISLTEGIIFTSQQLALNDKKVVVLNDVPVFSFNPKQCKFIRPLSFVNNCNENKNYFDKKIKLYGPSLQLASKNSNITFINSASVFCKDNDCLMGKDGKLFYRDSDHLNINGSLYVGKFIADEMKKNKFF